MSSYVDPLRPLVTKIDSADDDGIIIVLLDGNKRTQRRDLQRTKEEISRVNDATLT
jgi:CRISPR/Cas system-associated endoribonuclease Cas2